MLQIQWRVQKWRDQVQTARDTIGDVEKKLPDAQYGLPGGLKRSCIWVTMGGDLSQSCRK